MARKRYLSFRIAFIFSVFIAAAFAVGARMNHGNGFYPILDFSRFRSKVVILFVIFLLLMFFYAGDTAFIYFQF